MRHQIRLRPPPPARNSLRFSAKPHTAVCATRPVFPANVIICLHARRSGRECGTRGRFARRALDFQSHSPCQRPALNIFLFHADVNSGAVIASGSVWSGQFTPTRLKASGASSSAGSWGASIRSAASICRSTSPNSNFGIITGKTRTSSERRSADAEIAVLTFLTSRAPIKGPCRTQGRNQAQREDCDVAECG